MVLLLHKPLGSVKVTKITNLKKKAKGEDVKKLKK